MKRFGKKDGQPTCRCLLCWLLWLLARPFHDSEESPCKSSSPSVYPKFCLDSSRLGPSPDFPARWHAGWGEAHIQSQCELCERFKVVQEGCVAELSNTYVTHCKTALYQQSGLKNTVFVLLILLGANFQQQVTSIFRSIVFRSIVVPYRLTAFQMFGGEQLIQLGWRMCFGQHRCKKDAAAVGIRKGGVWTVDPGWDQWHQRTLSQLCRQEQTRCFAMRLPAYRFKREVPEDLEPIPVAIIGRPNVGKSTLFNRLQSGRSPSCERQAVAT